MQRVFVITGAAGTGKTSVAKWLQKKYGMVKVITHTTRQPRKGERNGVDYYFETPASMDKLHLLEKVQYDGHTYGSSKEALQAVWQQGKDAVIVLDTAGAITYQRCLGQKAQIIFLTVSHQRTLSRRLAGRGDLAQAIHSRLHSREYQRDLELPAALKGRAVVIKNDRWKNTTARLGQLLTDLADKGRIQNGR